MDRMSEKRKGRKNVAKVFFLLLLFSFDLPGFEIPVPVV